MLALIPLTEFGAKFIFYQKLYETCMNNKCYVEDPKIKTVTVLEERFGLPSKAFISRGEPDGFNPSKISIKKSKHYVSCLLHDLCRRERTTVTSNIVLLHLSRRGLGNCSFTSRVLIGGVLKNQIFPLRYPLSVRSCWESR